MAEVVRTGNDVRFRVDDSVGGFAERLGQAFGTHLRRLGVAAQVVVGADNRLSSRPLKEALIKGLVTSGAEVLDIGFSTTPLLYFAQQHLGLEAAVMVTGSHLPPDCNGFKLCRGLGAILGGEIDQILALVERGDFLSGEGRVQEACVLPAYFSDLRGRLTLGSRRLKAVVDAGNGTVGPLALHLLEDLGCEVVPLYCEPDATYPHHFPDPGRDENLQDLIAQVKQTGADVGLAFDGDGDRLGAVDEQGNIIRPDRLLILFAREILAQRPGSPIVLEVKCSDALVEVIRKHGGRPTYSKVGHSQVKAKMREVQAPLGGELSGHISFADEYRGFDDALYAAARLLRILSRTAQPLSALFADVPAYYTTPEVRPEVTPGERRWAIVEELTAHFQQADCECLTLDGVKFRTADGWGLIRASNNEPQLTIRVEAKTPEGLQRLQRAVEEALGKYPEVERLDW
ncbi:MAG TPA: phosphomannomutase/phosphoglucomutase [Armatimonadetes bacterium]|nr:phosphomannomutase/phosphoglucomutase [Armatimonadota bacterium]